MDKQRVINAVKGAGSSDDGEVMGLNVLDTKGEQWEFNFDTSAAPMIISHLEQELLKADKKRHAIDPTKPKFAKARKVLEFRVQLDPLRNEPILAVQTEGFELSFGMSTDTARELQEILGKILEDAGTQSLSQH